MAAAQPRPEYSSPAPDLGTLLGRVAHADELALAEVYRHSSRQVFGLVLAIVRDRSTAEEVTLDVYAQVWQQARGFAPARGSALGWLLTIARSRAIDKARALARAMDHAAIEKLTTELFAGEAGPLECAASSERGRRVRDAIAELPRGQREAITAAYYQGLSHAEISAALGAPLGTVKTRIRAAMHALASTLSGVDEAP